MWWPQDLLPAPPASVTLSPMLATLLTLGPAALDPTAASRGRPLTLRPSGLF